jgi:hypothetical protein
VSAVEALSREAPCPGGYESASQFSHEFKRMFGRTLVDEADRMRRAFARPYPGAPSGYVSSH